MVKVSTRPQETATAAAPTVTSVTAPRRPERLDQGEALHDLLEQARVVCVLLTHNYGGDGGFPKPEAAPGIDWLPNLVATLLGSADALANEIYDVKPRTEETIQHALALADHLHGLSGEELLDGSVGFRLGDHMVAGSYWTVEQLINKAMNAAQGGAQ